MPKITRHYLVKAEVRVDVDPAKFTPEFMEEFRKNFFDFQTIEDHTNYLARVCATEPDVTTIEGYGSLSDMGIELTYEGSEGADAVYADLAHVPNPPEDRAAKVWFDKVYDILCTAGADPSARESFVFSHTSSTPCAEWRFQGSLGFGGKYWRCDNRVSCYAEDLTDETNAIVDRTNKELKALAQ